jgi:lipoprotein-anchoring transpeptidase ErfK/SrfK
MLNYFHYLADFNMSDETTTINKKLKLGIDAARAGQKNIAQVHLNAVLQLDPDNIPAMFWLAYVSPSAEESIRLFERILELDPNNERAKAGMQWARGRLTAQMAGVPEEVRPGTGPLSEGQQLRKNILSGKGQDEARKGVLAHRARRTIDSMTILLILVSVLTMIALGLMALTVVPSDTLAAWLPASTPGADIPPLAAPAPVVAQPSPTVPVLTSLTSANDTVLIEPSLLTVAESEVVDTSPVATESGPDTAAEASLAVPMAIPAPIFEMPNLIGPTLPTPEPEVIPATEVEAVNQAEPAPDVEPVPVVEPEPVVPPFDGIFLAHQPAYPGEKWIEVNVTTQQVTAWEGDVPVMSFAVSTGLPNTPTVLGEYNIYWKLESTLMSGPGYYLPDVPYTMYFYAGYALHGTYWHENFGQPMSHGCVNLETGNAQQLFDWAGPAIPPGQTQVTATADNPGTLVVVHQ